MKPILLLVAGIVISSCSSFYEFSSKTEEKEMYRAFKMPVGKDSIDFNAYNDYYHDTINLDVVYITVKELNQLKKSTVKSARNKQILFLHNDTPYYLNVIGYFYPDLLLNEIKIPKFEYQPISLTSGKGFEYEFNQKQIADFYVPHSNGVLRFLAVGNPVWNEANSDRFHKEVDFVFYVINPKFFRQKPKEN